MPKVEIKKNIFWVGAVDWNIRTFHGRTYSTKRGSTYNAYLILDEKIALVDTVLASFSQEMIQRIGQVVPPSKIDYIIVNHIEMDHSGALPEIMKLCPKAKLFGTQKCKEGLVKHYGSCWDFQVVKSQDELKLGKNTLTFIEAAMIHWPDSMFTYCLQEELLFPNDAFGQHYATSGRFDDQADPCALFDETAKYYANILWPLGSVIAKKIEEIQKMNIPIKMIAPSHGVIWRKDPGKIIGAYLSWAKSQAKQKVAIVYETMYGSTDRMAKKIAEGIMDSGVEVKLFDITQSDRTEVIAEMLDSKGYIIGSSTHDNDMLTTISGFLEFLRGLKPKNRLGCAFGSYGWAGGAAKNIENRLKETGIEITHPALAVQYVPSEDELTKCYELGRDFANKIKEII